MQIKDKADLSKVHFIKEMNTVNHNKLKIYGCGDIYSGSLDEHMNIKEKSEKPIMHQYYIDKIGDSSVCIEEIEPKY